MKIENNLRHSILILLATLWIWQAANLGMTAGNAAEPGTNSTSAAGGKVMELFPDKVVARGIDFAIKRSQVDEAFIAFRASLAAQGKSVPEGSRDDLEKQVLERLINVQVMLCKATEADKTKAKQLAELKLEEYRKRLPSEEAFKRQLLVYGMTLEKFQDRMLEEAKFTQVIDRELRANLTVPDSEIKDFYQTNSAQFDLPERIRLSRLLILTQDPKSHQELPEPVKQEKKELAEKLLARAKAGEDFGKLAKEYSDDLLSRDNGGELPPLARGSMAPETEKAVFNLGVNQISDLLTTPYGYQFVKFLERMPARKISLAEAEKDIREYLTTQEVQKQLVEYLKKLRAEAKFDIFEPPGQKSF